MRHFSRMVKSKEPRLSPNLEEKHVEDERMDPLDPSIDAGFLAEMHLGNILMRYLKFTIINLKEMSICIF